MRERESTVTKLALSNARDGTPGHDSDQMGAVFSARMDVAVHQPSITAHSSHGIRGKGPGQRRFHTAMPEHTRRSAGHRNADAVSGYRDEHADDGIT